MTQQQASVMLEMMRYMDVDWRNVKIGQLEAYYNEREHLISELARVVEELMDMTLDSPNELLDKELHDHCRKLLSEV